MTAAARRPAVHAIAGAPATVRRLALAAAVSLAVILSAPFMGQIRAAVRTAFPESFVLIVAAAVAAAVAIAMALALARIRDRRRSRYALIGAALGLAGGYSIAFATGTPEVDVVERVHFVEYGVITYLFYRVWRDEAPLAALALPVLAAVLVGTLEEWFQWFIPVRVGEARDVLLNLVAIVCGLLFSVGLEAPSRTTSARVGTGYSRVLRVGAVVLLVFAAFVSSVHLGHAISDPEVGEFRSRYTRERLHALASDRSSRWRTHPPITFQRLAREDHYLDEGTWHVRRRNEAWSTGDYTTAWRENLILERYFAPVLNTQTYTGPQPHRWPDAQRAEAQARGAAETAYVSRAEPYPLVMVSQALFWTVASALVATLLALARLTTDD